MSSILYNIFISPIELIVEIVFELMYRLVGARETNEGIAVIGVSIAISLLTLPLYKRADAVQQKQRDLQNSMAHWVNHIKKTFKGDERFMMLQAYYRENHYSPLSALNGSISLLLEIPFFIAAYHFLSNLTALNGSSFLLISDLGQPDNLIKIGSFGINVLPVLMTLINCISAAIYLKGFPLKDKIQTYGMALIFLVLLYNSPSGLVIYWTCNNIFSLIKNIFYKLKNPKKVLCYVCAIAGTLFTLALFYSGRLDTNKKVYIIIVFQIAILIPLIVLLLRKFNIIKPKQNLDKSDSESPFLSYFLTALFLVILTGILIPSSVISSSALEFIDIQNYRNPLHFLINSTCYAIGFFLLWGGIIRYMIPQSAKKYLDLILWIIAGIALLNYMCFGRKLGNLSSTLTFTDGLNISAKEKIINLLIICVVGILLFFLFHLRKLISVIMTVCIISISILSVTQICKTQKQISDTSFVKNLKNNSDIKPLFKLSKTGKNVIVFMLDRAISGYIPYIFDEKPVLKEQFKGFTYYPNTISHGFYTNFGTPGLFGGYEYTPEEINKRDKESLVKKHNEALKVLPVLFDQNGYEVTVIDPPYAGYSWIPDLSIYDDYPNIKKYIVSGVIKNKELSKDSGEDLLKLNNRNFFCYSIFKSLPLIVSPLFYSGGTYFNSDMVKNQKEFYEQFSVLTLLSKLTDISENNNTCLIIQNSSTHEPCELQLPDYELKSIVDNTGLKTAADGHIKMDDMNQRIHYYANVASLLQIGKWFSFMQQNGVYDNTRIILVADHGRGLSQFDYMLLKNPEIDVEWCNPLLMVKDFNSKDFSVSNDFMTNADTPALAVKDIILNPANPFTGKIISSDSKNQKPQLITGSHLWNTDSKRTTFDTSDGKWYSVKDNIFKEENWKIVE